MVSPAYLELPIYLKAFELHIFLLIKTEQPCMMTYVGARAVGPAGTAAGASSPFDLLPGSLLGVILGMAGLWKGEGRERAVPRARVKLVF